MSKDNGTGMGIITVNIKGKLDLIDRLRALINGRIRIEVAFDPAIAMENLHARRRGQATKDPVTRLECFTDPLLKQGR